MEAECGRAVAAALDALRRQYAAMLQQLSARERQRLCGRRQRATALVRDINKHIHTPGSESLEILKLIRTTDSENYCDQFL